MAKKVIVTFPVNSTQFGLDYGSQCFVVNGSDPDSTVKRYKSLVEVALDLPEGCTIAMERSGGSYDWEDRNEFVEICKSKNITIKTINQNKTKNYRYDHGLTAKYKDGTKKKQSELDIEDARIIYHIVFETKYFTGTLQKIEPPELDGEDPIKDVNALIRIARAPRNKYKEQNIWLKEHDLEECSVNAQWLIAAKYVRSIGENRKKFDYLCGLYGLGKRSIVRASANRDFLRAEMKRRNEEISDNVSRKEQLKKMRKLARKIFWLTSRTTKDTVLSKWFKPVVKGPRVPEMGTLVSKQLELV